MILRGSIFLPDFLTTLILSIYLIIKKLGLTISFLNSAILVH